MDLRDAGFTADGRLPEQPGAWARLVDEVWAWGGTSIISHELFSSATLEQVDRVMKELSFAEVHLIYTARDLARQIPAAWREAVQNRHVLGFADFIRSLREPAESLREPAESRHPLAATFWRTQDAADVLGRWARDVPPERVHVVTAPLTGILRPVLWRRFASVVGLDPKLCGDVAGTANCSLGAVEAALLSRLNLVLDDSVPWSVYERFVKHYVAREVLVGRPGASEIALSGDDRAWAIARSKELVTELRRADYDVVGTLDELLPSTSPEGEDCTRSGICPTQPQLEAAIDVIVALLERLARPSRMRTRIHDLEQGLERRRRQPVKTVVRDLSESSGAAMRARVAWWHATERALRGKRSIQGSLSGSPSQRRGDVPDSPSPAHRAGGKLVFLHVGAPKTGTTFLQNVLWQNRHALAEAGVCYPLDWPMEHLRATQDLRRERRDPQWRGAWDRVAERARAWPGPTVVISDERLGGATKRQVRRAVESLQPAEVHVIFTVRDLARQLASDWQEELKHRHTVTFRRFVDDLIEFGIDAPPPFGQMFWGLHDAVRVLGSWGTSVPPERMHIVTVPQPGGPRGLLWERFAGLVGLDREAYDTTGARSNSALGATEASVLRHLNAALDRGSHSLEWPEYEELVKQYIAQQVLVQRPNPRKITLPDDQHDWVVGYSKKLTQELRNLGCEVVGDLDELIPARVPDPSGCQTPEETPAELQLQGALETAAALVQRAESVREAEEDELEKRMQELEVELERSRRGRRSPSHTISSKGAQR